MTRGRTIWLTIVVVVVALAAGLAVLVSSIRNEVRDAYASEWVAVHIIQYMVAHDGNWPRGWSDLRPLHEQSVSAGKCPWPFEMLQERVVVDWTADPAKLLCMPEAPDVPPFQVVSLRNGNRTYWQGMEPNALIHEWLRSNIDEVTTGAARYWEGGDTFLMTITNETEAFKQQVGRPQ